MTWINVIIDRGLYDRDFVEQWTYGFEQLKQRAAEYTPERAKGGTPVSLLLNLFAPVLAGF
jgi:anaerobic selenocysteine-containing dehydrogenase